MGSALARGVRGRKRHPKSRAPSLQIVRLWYNRGRTGGGARVDDWGRLLSGCRGKTSTAGSNPALPAWLLCAPS